MDEAAEARMKIIGKNLQRTRGRKACRQNVAGRQRHRPTHYAERGQVLVQEKYRTKKTGLGRKE